MRARESVSVNDVKFACMCWALGYLVTSELERATKAIVSAA